MRFGRVEGVVLPIERDGEPWLRLTVSLETGNDFYVIRDEELRPLTPIRGVEDLVWHADQLTQETIGVDLAEQGWEVIGADEPPIPAPGEVAQSATYAVRNLVYQTSSPIRRS